MKIEIDQGSGFCFGVTRAINKAEEELGQGSALYCLGDIVHNGKECDRLKKLGLITIDHKAFAGLHRAKVLLRAHGEPPATYQQARANGIDIIDATCPVVLHLQERIKKEYQSGGTPGRQIVPKRPNPWKDSVKSWNTSRRISLRRPPSATTTPSAARWPTVCRTSASSPPGTT